MGKAINQFRQLCRPQPPVSLSPSGSSSGTHSSISVIETVEIEELCSCLHTELINHDDCDTDEDEDAYVCEFKANDHYRLCKARAAHDLVLNTAVALLAEKPLSATAAPHLRTQDLITKLDGVATVVDLDVRTILPEQLKHPVLSIPRSWIEGSISLDHRVPEI